MAELNDAMRESVKGLERALHFAFEAGKSDLLTMPLEEIEKLKPLVILPLPQAMQMLCSAREAYADMRERMTLVALGPHANKSSFQLI